MKQQYIESEDMIVREEEGNVNFKKWFFRLLRLWPWIVVSLVLCLVAAYLYILYTPPVYKAVASLMVKDEKRGEDMMNNSVLSEIGLGGSANKLVENEIEKLRSYDLMEDVVDSLQLFVSINKVRQITDVAVFGDEVPFSVELINPDVIKNPTKWTIRDTVNAFVFQSEEVKSPQLFEYGRIYNSGGIRFRCLRTYQNSDSSSVQMAGIPVDYKVDINTPNQTVARYTGQLSVEAASKVATVINLQMKDGNKKRAAAILQTLITIYNEQGLNDKNRVTDNTIAFLNDRLIAVANELRGVEGSVEKFKSQNSVTELSDNAQQYLVSSQQVDAQKAHSQTQMNIINALERDLEQNQEDPQLVPSTLGIQEPSLGQLIVKHNELILQKERLLLKSGPKNPLLIDQQNQIRELRSRLLTNVRSLKQAYTISLDDISRKDAQLNNRIRSMPQLEKKLVQITRNQNVQEQLYAFLLQKSEEAAVTRASNIEDSRTIVKARSLGTVSPKKNVVWIIAILTGLLFPIGFISLKDFMNNKVGDIMQVQQRTDVPLLGVISHVRKRRSPVVMSSFSRSAVSEQIRNIRTAIGLVGKRNDFSFSGNRKEIKAIMVASYQPGDGKSFVSLNLAASYALLDKKTVILEFDLRRPRISKDLGIVAETGIGSILRSNSDPDDLLVEIPGFNNNLFLLPAGDPPDNPAELISGPNMKNLIKWLQERFDHIIIDTPAMGLVTDATLLQQYADVTIIVLRQDYTSNEVYTELKQRLSRDPDKLVYILLNDLGKRKRYRGGFGYGGYGYGYGNRYSNVYYREEK